MTFETSAAEETLFAMGDTRGVAPRGDAAVGIDTFGRTSAPNTKIAPTCAGGTTLTDAPAKEFHP